MRDRWREIASEQQQQEHALQVQGEQKRWDEEQDEQVRRFINSLGLVICRSPLSLSLSLAAARLEATGPHRQGHRRAHGPVCGVGEE